MSVNSVPKHDSVWKLVAQREMRVRTRSKVFWVSTAAMVILIIGGVLAAHFLTGGTTTYRVAVTSAAGSDIVRAADGISSDTSFESELVATAADAQSAVTAGDVDGALIGIPDGRAAWTLQSEGTADAALQGSIAGVVQVSAIAANAQLLGIDPVAVTSGSQLTVESLGNSSSDAAFQWGIAFAFGLLFFLSCQLFGSTIANGVAEEKESRVVEVLLAAIPTRSLLIGKIVGNALLGIGQMALFAIAALAAATVVGDIPHVDQITESAGWFLLYYVIGFGTVCCLFAGLGALASRTQDLQAATAPVQLIITATYLVSVIGKGAVLTIASFVPVASTVTMPARIFAGTAAWWEVAISLALSIGFAVLAVQVAARAYRYSVLRTGGRTSLLASLRGREVQPEPALAGSAKGANRV